MIKLITLIRPVARYFLIAWVITIIFVSSTPSLPTLKVHTAKSEIRLDFLIHFLEYGSLAFFTFLTFAEDYFILRFRKASLITFILTLFAILDEYHQKIIPGRTFNQKDILSNISGILAGLIFCYLLFRKISNDLKPV